VTAVTKNIFLRGQYDRKLRDRQLGHFIVKERIGKHNYKLKLPAIVRLHPVFHLTIYDHALQLLVGMLSM
jgi:hypothetical protein